VRALDETREEVPLQADDLSYGIDVTGLDPASLNDALKAVLTDAMADPLRMSTWLSGFALAEQNVGLNMLRRLGGQEAMAPFGQSQAAPDKRFSEPEWSSNPLLAGIVEDYQVRTQAALQLVDSARLPDATRRKARFAMQLMFDAFAPSNVPWLNPGVVKEAMNTGGLSLLQGMRNFMDDLQNNGGYPRQVDATGFELGKNIAATPGRVVMRNELIELIAYDPQTPKVHAIPLLCSPPWINKYYIMDLAPGRSFVEWAVQHGHQVFMISYRNPDERMSHYKMDDYLRSGVLAALDAVQEITGAKKVNVAALCLGGTLALIAMAYLAAHGQSDRINSLTVTNTLIDFSIPGDLGKISAPLYVLGAENDHIAPWNATYLTTQYVGGEAKYTLTNSGHIAGIVNPPGGKKSLFYTKPAARRGESAQEWFETSDRRQGSWWEDWATWADVHGGEMVAPFPVPSGEPAPGRYVRNEAAPPFEPEAVARTS
jgi:polyhydroxyalkanoate synthase